MLTQQEDILTIWIDKVVSLLSEVWQMPVTWHVQNYN